MTGLRERQKAGRREGILKAASELFRREGFAATSMEQVAELAQLSVGTLYNYFGSKGDLLLALVALDGAQVRAAGARLVARPPADPVAATRALLEGYVDHSLVHLDKRMWRHMMGTALTFAETPIGAGYRALDRKLVAQVAALCRTLQQRGDLEADLDCQHAGEVLFYVCNSLFMEFVAEDAMPLAALKKRMAREVRVVFDGLYPAISPRAGVRRRRRVGAYSPSPPKVDRIEAKGNSSRAP
jgi:AcrR family transcriptional regulator